MYSMYYVAQLNAWLSRLDIDNLVWYVPGRNIPNGTVEPYKLLVKQTGLYLIG